MFTPSDTVIEMFAKLPAARGATQLAGGRIERRPGRLAGDGEREFGAFRIGS